MTWVWCFMKISVWGTQNMYLKILTSIIKERNPDSAINNLVLLSLRAIEQVISRNMMVIMTFLWCLFLFNNKYVSLWVVYWLQRIYRVSHFWRRSYQQLGQCWPIHNELTNKDLVYSCLIQCIHGSNFIIAGMTHRTLYD